MNSVHDMGGMHGMGPSKYEKNEPVFHARWEGRVLALTSAMGPWRLPGSSRFEQEQIPAAEYLRMSYYERWFTVLVERMVKGGLVTRQEIKSGKRAGGSPKAVPRLTAAQVRATPASAGRTDRPVVTPLFRVGQAVRARNMHPPGHTRLPRYTRGRLGTIDRDHGVSRPPDTSAQGLGAKPQHIYSVRFAARELWGEQAAPRDAVYVDLWDDYLEPA